MTMHVNQTRIFRERIEELEEELRQIKLEICSPNNPFIGKLKMTVQLASLLWTLYKTPGVVTIGRLNVITREYGQRKPGDGSNTTNCTKVRITHLRNRLRRYGVKIENVWAVGYTIEPASKKKLRKIMERWK
jgi:DNA-binding response OmpR family regulator